MPDSPEVKVFSRIVGFGSVEEEVRIEFGEVAVILSMQEAYDLWMRLGQEAKFKMPREPEIEYGPGDDLGKYVWAAQQILEGE